MVACSTVILPGFITGVSACTPEKSSGRPVSSGGGLSSAGAAVIELMNGKALLQPLSSKLTASITPSGKRMELPGQAFLFILYPRLPLSKSRGKNTILSVK